MNQAKKARDNALQLEVKKDGLQQRQNGDWVLRFTAQNIDMHQVIVNAPMGTRFWCSLIELNDDETPVDHKAMERHGTFAAGGDALSGKDVLGTPERE
jgi:hypothetical protein